MNKQIYTQGSPMTHETDKQGSVLESSVHATRNMLRVLCSTIARGLYTIREVRTLWIK